MRAFVSLLVVCVGVCVGGGGWGRREREREVGETEKP